MAGANKQYLRQQINKIEVCSRHVPVSQSWIARDTFRGLYSNDTSLAVTNVLKVTMSFTQWVGCLGLPAGHTCQGIHGNDPADLQRLPTLNAKSMRLDSLMTGIVKSTQQISNYYKWTSDLYQAYERAWPMKRKCLQTGLKSWNSYL